MEELNIIKEKIRTMNPEITDELLDLLYEFIIHRHVVDFKTYVTSESVADILSYVVNPLSFRNN